MLLRERRGSSGDPALARRATARSSSLPPRDASSAIARRCERAVVTAYRELRAHGIGDLAAFNACATLYRIHHPEAQLGEARRLAAEWIDHHVVRGEAGPTPGCDCG
jgi:hypothetical protein